MCPCELHYLPVHPKTYQDALLRSGTTCFGAWNVVCWCECDHAEDEARWAA